MHYHPLNETQREIRLLRLLPESEGLEPQCTLHHHSLDQEPQYIALSYCWGDPNDTRDILVGGNSLSVTKNLHAALVHLRHQSEVVCLWIDAICINQQDDAEKSWQVQLMRVIYQHASEVIVWLGPASPHTDTAMDYLNELGEMATRWMQSSTIHELTTAHQQWLCLAQAPSQPRNLAELTTAEKLYIAVSGTENGMVIPVEQLVEFFNQSWFRRVWTLQEVALSKQSTFHCGTKTIRFTQLVTAFGMCTRLRSVLRELSRPFTNYEYQVVEKLTQRPVDHIVVLRCTSYPLAYRLLATSSTAAYCEATDPRDKIFGILGVVDDGEDLAKLGLIPDYTLAPCDVYTNAMVAMIQLGHTNMIAFVRFPKALKGLPSWVPDFSMPISGGIQQSLLDGRIHPVFLASKHLKPAIRADRVDGRIAGLTLSGIIIDSILNLGETFSFIDGKCSVDDLSRWLSHLFEFTYQSSDSFANVEERIDAAIRTSTADISCHSSAPTRMTAESKFVAKLCILYKNPEMLKDSRYAAELESSGKTKAEIWEALVRAGIQKYASDVQGQSPRHLSIITANGHLGLGPMNAQKGDLVAVLAGLQVPCILRPASEGKYEFIGEAYVDGIMDGEAVGDRVDGEMISLI